MASADAAKWDWLLRQEPGTLAEQCLLQAFVIACHHKPTTVDGGRVFPPFHVWLTSEEITRRTGMNERTIPQVVERLRQRGLLAPVRPGHGRTGQIKVYRLTVTAGATPQEAAGLHAPETPQETALFDEVQSLQVPASKDRSFLQLPYRKKREVRREVVRGAKSSRKPSLPECPHQSIVDIYHEVLPELPRCRVLEKSRKRLINEAWRFAFTTPKSDGTPRATTLEDALDWFRRFFEKVQTIDWMMGRTPKGRRSTFDYLLSDRGRTMVIESEDERAADWTRNYT